MKWHKTVLFPLRAYFSSCQSAFVVLFFRRERGLETCAFPLRPLSITGLFSEFSSIDLNVGSSDLFGEDWWMVLSNIHLCSGFARLRKSSVLVTHYELLEKELVLMILHEPQICTQLSTPCFHMVLDYISYGHNLADKQGGLQPGDGEEGKKKEEEDAVEE
ncbi:hypothetical protein MUK42_33107 [Musa troglodytarum]|uniref:Uncharacterized protein n=1 Tax=Musa troglodytarum TaxID=320322 RepID=A0A9E7FE14_9LILI|nr:hypothetical protein MUK42_33107 [Musa troglodytarum]